MKTKQNKNKKRLFIVQIFKQLVDCLLYVYNAYIQTKFSKCLPKVTFLIQYVSLHSTSSSIPRFYIDNIIILNFVTFIKTCNKKDKNSSFTTIKR